MLAEAERVLYQPAQSSTRHREGEAAKAIEVYDVDSGLLRFARNDGQSFAAGISDIA
jgi:hypothetical protein